MLFVGNVFLVEVVDVHLLLSVSGFEEIDKVAHKLIAVFVDVFLWIFTDYEHLAHVAFRHAMLLEGVGIATLLLAYLAIPS